MVAWEQLIEEPAVQAAIVLVIGFVIGLLVGVLSRRLMRAAGVPDLVEGTSFERSAQSLGTSTVDIVARLTSWFVYGVSIVTAIHVGRVLNAQVFWTRFANFVPQLFVAAFVLVVGFVFADKAELVVSERIRSVELPEAAIVPKLLKYTILYVAILVALGEIRVSTRALVVLLGAYLFAVIFLGGLAFRDFLRSGASGVYILLREPYSIGDEIRIDDRHGIVQDVDVFVTRIEDDGREYVVPNHRVFRTGLMRVRE